MPNAEIAAIRAMLAQSPKDLSLPELRALYDGLGAQFPTPPDIRIEPAELGAAPAEWTTSPGADPERVLLYLHGGGYVIGSLRSHRHLVAALGRAAGCRTLAVDYRLAPEHPFPAAVEDALSAYRALLATGVAPGSVAVAGDSAGGGLTLALLLAARDAGLPQPSSALCISPWVDLEALGASMDEKASEDPMVAREGLVAWGGLYLDGASPRNPLAAPLHADLRGLAPLHIQVGSAETLLDDAVRIAARAGAAEVEVRLEIWPEMIHVWHFFHPGLSEARRAIETAGTEIRRRFV